MGIKEIAVDRLDGVVVVTLNRAAKKNAMTRAMWAELKSIIDEVDQTPADRVMILTGAGDAFCAGGDIDDWSGGDQLGLGDQADDLRRVQSTALALYQCSTPTIAAINGVAVGGGFTLALGCDLTIAAENARLGAVFIRRGLVPDLGGHWLLPRLIGLHRAKQVAMLGEMMDVRKAEALGLLNQIVPEGEALSAAQTMASQLSAFSPGSLSSIKRTLNQSFEVPMSATLEHEVLAQILAVGSADYQAAAKEFIRR